jgi:hypothetical protein
LHALHLRVLLFGDLAAEGLGLPHLLVEHRRLSDLCAEEAERQPAGHQGDYDHRAEPPRLRDDAGEGVAWRENDPDQPRHEVVRSFGDGRRRRRPLWDVVAHDDLSCGSWAGRGM